MADPSVHPAGACYQVLLLHTADIDTRPCDEWPGITCHHATSEEELQTVLSQRIVHATVVSGSWHDPALHALIAALKALAPDMAWLWNGEEAMLPYTGAFACLPSLVFDALTHRMLAAAHAVTVSQQELTLARQSLNTLNTLAESLSDENSPGNIAESLLDTALTLVRMQLSPLNRGLLTGAVLTVGNGLHLVVQAARTPYADCMGRTLPISLQADVHQAVEHNTILGTGSRLVIPLAWHGQQLGALLLEGADLPLTPPDELLLLVNQAASALESASLYNLAAVDTTTRTFTRAFVVQRLYEALKSAFRTGLDLTVLMLDLDKFKQVNDTYGHLVGDRVLQSAGELLHGCLRESDVLGRYGGDEFLIILPNTPIAGGVEVARRLLKSVDQFSLEIDGQSLKLSISVGIGGICRDDYPVSMASRPAHEFFQRVMERLISQADGFMYRAKHGSKARYAAALPLSWGSLLANERVISG